MRDFIGPLTPEQQRWAEEVMAVDAAAAVFEPLPAVLRRRERQIAADFQAAALMFLTDDQQAGLQVRRAVAEARGLAWLSSNDPDGCRDCDSAGSPCPSHRSTGSERRRRTSHERWAGPGPEWRRFGSDAGG